MNFLSTILVIALASVAIAQDVTTDSVLQGCERPCPKNYMPVCGFDGVHHQLFNNECLMENEHCKNGRTWSQTRMNQCLFRTEVAEKKMCEVPCTRELRPTCGTDGKDHRFFNNPCELKNQHCLDGHQWFETRTRDCLIVLDAHFPSRKDMCETPCTREMRPTCGFDGQHHKLFNNPCMMKNEHCKNGRNWVQTRMADCLVRSNDDECPTICADIYAPVCGFNGVEHKVFASECVMAAHNCQISPRRFFVKTPLSECPEHIF